MLWVRFLGEDDGEPRRPTLAMGPGEDAQAFGLTDRARWLLAAISLPRELASGSVADDRRGRRLGPGVWSSGEIMKRIPYQHRSTIRLALGDLRAVLVEAGLQLDDYLALDTQLGRYGMNASRTRVDVVELHRAREEPDEVDRIVAASVADPRRASLPTLTRELFRAPAWGEITELVALARDRATEVSRIPSPPANPQTPPPPPNPQTPAATDAHARPLPPPNAPEPSPSADERRWRPAATIAVAAAVLIAVVLAVVLATSDADTPAPLGPPRAEVAGGLAHTWSDPRTAGGRMSVPLRDGEAVSIACRVRGFQVQDGDVWWYRIRSRPWSGRFYATADAFYNDGRTSGSLKGTLFVDRRIPDCR